jgi:hypothetical protein
MRGDDRIRFCARCRLNVYDLSAMDEAEIEELASREGHPPCVRFFMRADGTVLSRDCPVGRRWKWFVGGAWLAAALVLVGLFFLVLQEQRLDARSVADWCDGFLDRIIPSRRPVMGKMTEPVR